MNNGKLLYSDSVRNVPTQEGREFKDKIFAALLPIIQKYAEENFNLSDIHRATTDASTDAIWHVIAKHS